MTYKTRKISIVISLADGSFSSSANDNTMTISDARCIFTKDITGGITGYTLNGEIYGISMDNMVKISGTGFKFSNMVGNKIKISVNDVLFFEGVIQWARPDPSQSPDVPLLITAAAQPEKFNSTITDTSLPSGSTLKTVLSTLGAKVGISVGNCEADLKLSAIYLKGSFADQLKAIQDAVRVATYNVKIDYDVEHINAYQGSNSSLDAIELSASSGLLGYPIFTEMGLYCTAIYDPKYQLGKRIKLKSVVPNASGEYRIEYSSSVQVSSWVDNGPFFVNLNLVPWSGT